MFTATSTPPFARLTTLLAACAATSAMVLATPAFAAVVTSIDGPTTARPLPSSDEMTDSSTSAPGMTFTSTTSNSVFGYTSSYGLGNNGMWNGGLGPYIGLNANGSDQFMTLSFDDPVASVFAFVNYAYGYGNAYMSVYDSMNQLIESHTLDISTPYATNGGTMLGFAESSNIIKSIRFGDAYIVAANVQTGLAAVPVAGTLPLVGLGLAGLVFATTRRRRSMGGATPAVAAG